MKKYILLTIFSAVLTFAQNPIPDIDYPESKREVGRDDEGHWVREYYKYNVKSLRLLETFFDFGMGELELEANSRRGLIEGNLRYYSDRETPIVDFHKFGSKGTLIVKSESLGHHKDGGMHISWGDLRKIKDPDTINNELYFALPKNIDTDLNLDFGLGEVNIDLDDLSIINMNLDCGLSEVRLELTKPNPVICKFLRIESGLGEFVGVGLGNLRSRRIDFEIGLGSAEIDLRGDFSNDMDVEIDVGLGSLELILPRNTNIELQVNENFLSSVDISGLHEDNGRWVSPNWESSDPTMTLHINVGLGSVEIDVRR